MEEISWGPLGKTVYDRTLTYEGRWYEGDLAETVERVVDGNLALAGLLAGDERDELIERMSDFRIIPAGRHLWASGSKSKLGLFNCWRAGWGPSLADHFVFTFDQLMLGGGVGANYSREYLAPLEKVRTELDVRFNMAPGHPDRAAFVQSGLKEDTGCVRLCSMSRIPVRVGCRRFGICSLLRLLRTWGVSRCGLCLMCRVSVVLALRFLGLAVRLRGRSRSCSLLRWLVC